MNYYCQKLEETADEVKKTFVEKSYCYNVLERVRVTVPFGWDHGCCVALGATGISRSTVALFSVSLHENSKQRRRFCNKFVSFSINQRRLRNVLQLCTLVCDWDNTNDLHYGNNWQSLRCRRISYWNESSSRSLQSYLSKGELSI